jgi:integrase
MSDQWRRGKHRDKYCGVIGTGDSRRRAALYTVQGKRITNDAKEADAAIRRLNADTERALLPKHISMDQLYALYEKDREEHGVVNLQRIKEVGRTLRRIWGHLAPEEITREEVKRFTKIRRAAGCSDGTIRNDLAYIRAALGVAKRRGHTEATPEIALPPVPRPRERYLERTEVDGLIRGCAEFHVRLFVLLAITTAGRPKHILALTWDRVDLERRVIALDDLQQRTRKGRARVPINDTAMEALVLAREAAQTDWVIEVDGHPIKSIKRGVKAAAKRAGMPWVSQYMLRHTAAVWMAQAGVPIPEIGQYLGHSNVSTTYKTYARYSPEYLRKAATALEIGKQ